MTDPTSKRHPFCRRRLAGLFVGAALCFSSPDAQAQPEIFADGFESGNLSAWSSWVGAPPTPEAYRFTDLDLRDPHVFVELPLNICFDFTDTPPPLAQSFNELLAEAIGNDGDMDGFLDLSVLLLFRPLDLLADDLRLDQVSGLCTPPDVGTVCQGDPLIPPLISTYDGLDTGVCLAAEPGTTSGYSPMVAEPAAPCFVGAPQTLMLDFAGVMIPLQDAQVAGSWVGDPPTALFDGLLRGFLREEDADLLLLPPDLPLVGGMPLSVLLPGGTGNCAAGDDRDMLNGDLGWWFYLNFEAGPVPFVGV